MVENIGWTGSFRSIYTEMAIESEIRESSKGNIQYFQNWIWVWNYLNHFGTTFIRFRTGNHIFQSRLGDGLAYQNLKELAMSVIGVK